MQNEFDWHYPSLEIQILGLNEAGAPLPAPQGTGFITNDRDLPWLQDSDENSNGLSDVRDETWAAEWRDFVIVDRNSDWVTTYNLTTNRLDLDPANYTELKQLMVEAGMTPAETDWQNPVEPLDVDGDAILGPLDALNCIARLPGNGSNEFPGGILPTSRPGSMEFLDVNGDGFISPLDPLPIIKHITDRGPISSAVEAPLGGGTGGGAEVAATDQAFAVISSQVEETQADTPLASPDMQADEERATEEWSQRTDQALAGWTTPSVSRDMSVRDHGDRLITETDLDRLRMTEPWAAP